MSKYQIQIKETEVYLVEVNAENEQDAIDKAYEILDCSQDDKSEYHHDSDGEAEVVGIDKEELGNE